MNEPNFAPNPPHIAARLSRTAPHTASDVNASIHWMVTPCKLSQPFQT